MLMSLLYTDCCELLRIKVAEAEARILELEEANSHLQEGQAADRAAVQEHMALREKQTERIKKAKAGGLNGMLNQSINHSVSPASIQSINQCIISH